MITSARSSVGPHVRGLLFASLGLMVGCGLFSPALGTSEPSSGATGSRSEADAVMTEQDRALQAEVEAIWAEVDTDGITAARALALTDLLARAYRSGAVQRGHVNGPGLARATLDHVQDAIAAEPEAAADLHQAAGGIHQRLGEDDRAAAAYTASFDARARMEPFLALLTLPRDPVVNAAILGVCPRVRPLVTGPETADFVEACLVAAGGDGAQLQWEGVEGDLAAHQQEMARRAEEERRQAEEAAAAAAQRARVQVAAVFAAGRCSFGDCAGNGWEIQTEAGTVRVRCNFGDCLHKGWEAQFPDGSRARTSCNFGECMQKGWQTRLPDGQTAQTSCNFGECATKGWQTRLPDGSTAQTSCNFGECYTKGWQTRLPDGGRVDCRCNFGDCLQNGTDCG